MRRRIPLMAILSLFVAFQAAVPLVARTAPAAQQASGVTATLLGGGNGIQLYDFKFEPGASIDQQTIPEPMLVHVFGGSFVFYIPAAAGDTIYVRGGERPIAVVSSDCRLPPDRGELSECTFTTKRASKSSFSCTPDPQVSQYFRCTVSNQVAILVSPDTTLVLPGPTECFVCKLDADPGELEVAVAAAPDTFAWWIAVNNSSASSTSDSTTLRAFTLSGADPCQGRVR
jgi:hypothetical protein